MNIKKKSLALLVLTVFVVTNFLFVTKVFAIENTKETAYNLTLNDVTYADYIKSDGALWFKYTAQESKYYEFEIVNPYYNGQKYETFMTVQDSFEYDNEVGFADTDESTQKCIAYVNCTAGQTYYIQAYIDEAESYRLGMTVREHTHRYLEKDEIDKAYFFDNDAKAGTVTNKCSDCNYEYVKNLPKVKSVTLAKTKYTYDGKTKKPAVTIKDVNGNNLSKDNYIVNHFGGGKNVGNYLVDISFGGDYYGGWVYRYFKIVPKGTTISKLTAAKKAFTVKWKKQTTQTTGYQIRYSLKSNMSGSKTVTVKKNKTTKTTIKKLKAKKKYYVQIRTYKTVSGTKYYSDWSKTKTIKTKK